METENSELTFFLVDQEGHRRIPKKIRAKRGPYGYALHPKGEGNNPKAARYTEDLKELVQSVVLHGRGVRTVARSGSQRKRSNTLALGHKTVRGYWVCPSKRDWVAGAAIRPLDEVVE
jgi:hypothetical protein